MSKEIEEQLDYDDALLAFFSVCQQYGARKVLSDFRSLFPDMYEEVLVQINRLGPYGQIPALLK
jgi:hypothetical protein